MSEEYLKTLESGLDKLIANGITSFTKIDQIIALKQNQIQLLHIIKLSLWREHQAKTHDDQYWCENISGEERQKLFEQFLVLWRDAHDENWNGYERKTRSNHLKEFKSLMMWDYRYEHDGSKK